MFLNKTASFYGAVAQLIERVVRNDEVVGLIPICSTILRLSEAKAKDALHGLGDGGRLAFRSNLVHQPAGAEIGKVNQKVLPAPSWLVTPMLPPWDSTAIFAKVRPRPEPRRFCGLSNWANLAKIFC